VVLDGAMQSPGGTAESGRALPGASLRRPERRDQGRGTELY